jgi:hypothetical protein
MQRLSKIFMVVAFLVFFTGSAFAVSLGLDVDSISFNAEDKADVLGAGNSRTADGKPDASFSLAVSGAQAIKRISLKNETTGKTWSSSPSGTTELLIVKDSSGNILNASGGMPVTPVLLGADFKLYINDAVAAIPKDSDFTVIVTLIDNQDVIGKTNVKGLGTPAPAAPAAGEGITEFETNGISEHDFAGTSEKVVSDGKNDYQFTLALNFKDATVKAMKVSAQAPSKKADWDTITGNSLPIVTVIDSGNNILNKTDGTIGFNVKGSAKYLLLVQDKDGVMSDPAVKTKITISLSDGRMFEKDAAKGKTTALKDSLSAEYKGTGQYDFAGPSEKMESNLNADRQIDAVINVSGTVTGVRVKCTASGKIWDTIAGNNNPIVVLTDEKGAKQNKADGTLSMALNGEKKLSLWFDEEESKNVGPYQITFVMSNGQVLEASTGKAPAAQAVPAATVTKADRAAVFSSAKPALVNLDLVGKNKKRAASGSKDMALNVKITGKGNVTALVLTDNSGKGWDTLASNNGRWLIGVREGNKVLNQKNGTVRIPVNGTKTYQLLMQDNGTLAKKNGKLKLIVTWGDGQVTESSLNW